MILASICILSAILVGWFSHYYIYYHYYSDKYYKLSDDAHKWKCVENHINRVCNEISEKLLEHEKVKKCTHHLWWFLDPEFTVTLKDGTIFRQKWPFYQVTDRWDKETLYLMFDLCNRIKNETRN